MSANTVLLAKKFSKASRNYDELSLIQKEVADELLDRIGILSSVNSILDIGIGTGYLAKKIKSNYPDSDICGIDLALGMLGKTKQKMPEALLVQADAMDLPFKDELFDLVVSNLAYQWVGDLNRTLRQTKRIMKNEGKFYFSVFSQNTLKELREIVFELLDSNIKIHQLRSIAHLPHKSFLENALNEIGFREIKTGLKIKKQFYPNLLDLLNWLKLTGANKYWANRVYEGLSSRGFIDSISKKYKERFNVNGKIFATFEVLFVELVK